MNRVDDRIILITGAGRGIGAATAEIMSRAGGMVIITDVQSGPGEEVVRRITTSGGRSEFRQLDVTREQDWRETTRWIGNAFGGLDVLVNNAGVAFVKPLEETTLDAFRRVMDINVGGVFLGIKYCLPIMKGRARANAAGGSIVNVSSVVGIRGIADGVAYGTSKGAVRQLTKCAALEFARNGYNIRVNSVHPAMTDTPMVDEEVMVWAQRGSLGTHSSEEVRKLIGERLPMGRMARPEEIAKAILYLASNDSSFCTGIELPVDGGRLAQ